MTGLKHAVTDAVLAELEPLRIRHDDLLDDPAELAAVLNVGAEKALHQSSAVLTRARVAVGL